MFRQAEEIARNIPELSTVYYSQSGGLARETNKAALIIGLKPKSERVRTQQEIMRDVRKKSGRSPGLKGTAEDISLIGGGQRKRACTVQYSRKRP